MGNNNTGTENTTVTENNTVTEENTPKTYTQEEVNRLLQQEGDRRVTEALKKAEKKKAETLIGKEESCYWERSEQ